MGIKDVIETVKKPATLFFDGEYYDSVDELLAACNISRADYTQVKATHRDWDAMNVVDFLVKSNKGMLPSKNPQYKGKNVPAEEPVINLVNIPEEDKSSDNSAKEEVDDSDKPYVELKDSEVAEEAKTEEADKEAEPAEDDKKESDEAKSEEVKADEKDTKDDSESSKDAAESDTKSEDADATEGDKAAEDVKVEEKVEQTKEKKEAEVKAPNNKEEKSTMNEYDYTQAADAAKMDKAAVKPAPAPSGSTAKAFDELLVNLNIAKEGFLVVKQVQSDMSDLDIVNAILTTKGNPIGETSKDFDELLNNLNTPKIGFQLVKQIHNDWSDLDVINAIIKSR